MVEELDDEGPEPCDVIDLGTEYGLVGYRGGSEVWLKFYSGLPGVWTAYDPECSHLGRPTMLECLRALGHVPGVNPEGITGIHGRVIRTTAKRWKL